MSNKQTKGKKQAPRVRSSAPGLTARYVTFGEGCEGACEHCPYAEQCEACEGYWGCGAWEEGMGEDL